MTVRRKSVGFLWAAVAAGVILHFAVLSGGVITLPGCAFAAPANDEESLRAGVVPPGSAGAGAAGGKGDQINPPTGTKIEAANAAQTPQGPIAAASSRQESVNPKDGYELVLIPAGEFWMGGEEGEGFDNEKPRHKVYLKGYRVGKYEVTIGQYRRFCQDTGRKMPDQIDQRDLTPVINVTWNDADAYCTWAGLRLPTEAEWEKAARGGTLTSYWWGDAAPDSMANFAKETGSCSWVTVSPVGTFPPNPSGLYDTAGNVWEWVHDWFAEEYYRNSPSENPSGPPSGEERVLRGGSWYNTVESMRSARRARDVPEYSSDLLGFRCAGDAN